MIDATKLEQYIKDHREEAVSLLKELGRIPAPTREEDRRAIFCRDWFLSQGAERAWIDEAKNAICAIGVEEDNDLVVLMAHTDIVFPDTEELPMRQEGDLLYAPGIGDDTANLVNLMMGAKFLLTHKPAQKMGILIVANACEEGLGNLDGCKQIMKTYQGRVKAFYSFDGYLSQCTDVPVGSHRYRITARAEGGHSYLDFGKQNAIVVLSELVVALSSVTPPDLDKTTFNVGYIQGGSTVNSVPQECYCLYEYRSPSQECLEIMEGTLQRILGEFRQKGCELELELLGVRPGKGSFAPGVLEQFTEQSMEVIGRFCDGELEREPFSTDANVPLSMGIPANTIGTIIGDKAHTREEWVDLTSIQAGMGIVLGILEKYLV